MLLSLIAYGVMIPYRLLNFTDLTAEGAYPLGGVVCVSFNLMGLHPVISIILAAIIAGFTGILTSLIHIRFKVNSLLAGIILSTMLYSVNLRIIGKPNIALIETLPYLDSSNPTLNIIFLAITVVALLIPFSMFLRTEIGLRLRVVGLNPSLATSYNVSVNKYTFIGLFIANCFTGLAGSLIVHLQNYMDIGMGVGIVIHALAALMIGEAIVGTQSLNKQLIAPFIGALIYQQIQGLALALGFAPSDLKLLTGIIILGIVGVIKREV
jgi:putative ABC transport system permease protein